MSYRDVASWTVMISGLAKAGRMAEACKLFEEMPVKDVRAWNVMLDGFVGFECVDKAEILFQEMPEKDLDSWKLLLSGLVTSRRLVDALRYFMEMPMKCCKTLNSILLGLIRNGLVKEAHAFLEKQPYNDVVSWTNVVVGYFEIGEVRSAIKVFKLMPIQDVTVWNAMICGLGETDYGEEGFKIFIRMKESGFSPDEATFTSILTISSNLPSLDLGKQSHAQVVKSGLNNFTAVSNALVTMYERCGDLHSALREFFNMPSHDVISWNSIICGFAHHGNAEKALKMFELMRLTDIKPNQITFIGVLSACSHAGLVDQGKYYFDYMKNKCSLEPTTEHYTCIVDLLGRFGLIDEAMSFLNQMRADGIEVPASVWGALLGACRIHHNIKKCIFPVDEEKTLRAFEHAWRRRELGSNMGVVGLRQTTVANHILDISFWRQSHRILLITDEVILPPWKELNITQADKAVNLWPKSVCWGDLGCALHVPLQGIRFKIVSMAPQIDAQKRCVEILDPNRCDLNECGAV
ncbi:Pentatricopeptide repeat - like 10 [Theobroma cacao]|nr:Pentatricopeptide repeat - like 10 [Theobroma cacao]